MSEWPNSTLLPSTTSASQDATPSSGPAFTSANTNSEAVVALLQQLAAGTLGQQQIPLNVTAGLAASTHQQPSSSLIQQFLSSSVASSFPQQPDQLLNNQIQMPTTTTADLNNKNLQLLATLAALRVEEQNNHQLLANLEATTSAQLAVTTQQNTLASSLPTFATSSFAMEQPVVTTAAPSTQFDPLLLLLAASQQQGFCTNNELNCLTQQQQIPTLPTQQNNTLELLRQLQAINAQRQLLSPNSLLGTSSGTGFQASGSSSTSAALTQKPIITTVVPPQQTQSIPVKRGRPRRLTEGAQSFALMPRPQKIAETKAVDALSIATKPAGFVRPAGRVPTSSDSCSAIANYLMSYNKVDVLLVNGLSTLFLEL
jgi:hypothetical protein